MPTDSADPALDTLLANPRLHSHWMGDMYPADKGGLTLRPSLEGSREADICIVGAGYTGLWTAYELKRADPSLEIVILEAKMAGYGASGRNGGAVIAQFNGSRKYWTKRGGREGTIAMERAAQQAVDVIGETVAREKIDCKYSKNGVVIAARTELEAEHMRHSVEEDRNWGFGDEDSRWLSREETLERINIEGVLGARLGLHCASIHPGRLVRGLADVVERQGTTIYEGTPVTSIAPGVVKHAGGEVRAKVVQRATEAYTESLDSHRRVMVPVHTSMLVTEKLSKADLKAIGWGGREALLAEHPFLHLQHTADDRITIGGDDNRTPYLYGSAPSPDAPPPEKVAAMFASELTRLFPALAEVKFESSWQGIFAAPRNWAPGVGFDPATGMAWGGGYVGEGVAMSNLVGRTLADLIRGQDTELTRLPFVGPPARRWEPEPLRWIGSAAISRMRDRAIESEIRTGRPSRLMAFANRLAGFTGSVGG
jgi:glycine/D-amino acid oxidase-like deaminating enzyme